MSLNAPSKRRVSCRTVSNTCDQLIHCSTSLLPDGRMDIGKETTSHSLNGHMTSTRSLDPFATCELQPTQPYSFPPNPVCSLPLYTQRLHHHSSTIMASSSSVVDISTVARHPTTHLYCNFCLASKPGLLRCSGCQCVRYCDQEHQLINRESHKRVCNRIKKLKANMEKEERELRNHPGDSMMPENPFENCVGLFWGIQ